MSKTGVILVVDDEPLILELATTILEDCGREIIAVGRPSEALETARRLGRDMALLLTDLTMEGMDGVELAARIREFCPRARVIIMSGQDAGPAPGRHDFVFVRKPFSIDELLAAVDSELHAMTLVPGEPD